ncbi:MAG TPA: hypothetical protein VFZ11_03345 [Gemmatimonadaceae bacterium]
MLAVAIYSLSDIEARATKNRVASARATLLAEQGAAHAHRLLEDSLRGVSYTQLLRGSDGSAGTSDDGVLVGHGLSAEVEIPASGKAGVGGTYKVQLSDDPADPDGVNLVDRNYRIRARCSAVTDEGAKAAIDLIFYGPPSPAVAIDGDLKISGDMGVVGKCGSLQANGDIEIGASAVVVAGHLGAVGTVGPKVVKYPNGTTNAPATGMPPIPIPDLNPLDRCATADYIGQADGWIRRTSDNSLHNATSNSRFGWKRSGTGPIKWDFEDVSKVEGTFCFTGNVYLSANPGLPSDPFALSIYASGSVEISGNPYLEPAPGDSVTIVSGGDVSISGNPAAGANNFEGLIYAESQCKISGNPSVAGQLLCKDKANDAGTVDLVSINEFSGAALISYDCTGATRWRPQVFWVQPPD